MTSSFFSWESFKVLRAFFNRHIFHWKVEYVFDVGWTGLDHAKFFRWIAFWLTTLAMLVKKLQKLDAILTEHVASTNLRWNNAFFKGKEKLFQSFPKSTLIVSRLSEQVSKIFFLGFSNHYNHSISVWFIFLEFRFCSRLLNYTWQLLSEDWYFHSIVPDLFFD